MRAYDCPPGRGSSNHYWGLRDYEGVLAEFTTAGRLRPSDAEVAMMLPAVSNSSTSYGHDRGPRGPDGLSTRVEGGRLGDAVLPA